MKKLFLFFIFCSIFCTAKSQINEKNLSAKLESFSLKSPFEKCYVQTDRTKYFSNNWVFFKSYFTLSGKPSILSKVGYIVLTDYSGKVIEKKMLKIKNGSSSGELKLPENLKSGTYFLKGFTLWMLNSPELIYTKIIDVVNPKDIGVQKVNKKEANKISIGFFPEGGQLISEIDNTVAFKSINQYGVPVKIDGNIVNQNNELVAKISTTHNGMGTFIIKPQIGKKYFAKIKDEFAVEYTIDIQNVLDEGVSMHVDNLNEKKIFINLNRAEKNKEKYNDFILIAQQSNKLVYYASINFEEGLDAVAINKKLLQNGIVQITLLTKDGIPILERLAFINNNIIDSTKEFNFPNINFEKRAKNNFQIDLKEYQNPDVAISVVNYNEDSNQNHDNLLSSMLLSSESKELIYKPATYFENNSEASKRNLDLLMLTHGWRKYNWKSIIKNDYDKINYPFEQSLNITGQLMAVNGKTNLKDGKINFIVKGVDSTVIQSQVDVNTNPNFGLDGFDFEKSAKVFYQGSNLNRTDALVSVKINPHFFDTLSKSPISKNNFEQSTNDIIYKQSSELGNRMLKYQKTLDSVIVKTKLPSETDKLNKEYVSDLFLESDQTLKVDGNFFDIWQFLQRSVPGIAIDKAVSGTRVNFTRYNGLDFFNEPDEASGVQFFLNEVQVSNDIIDALNPNDISVVKIYKGVSSIALGLNKGGIAIYTKKNISGQDWRSKGFEFFQKTGYSTSIEFFNMDYSKYKFTNQFLDDRTTLYWNTKLKTTENGKLNVEFYNDDFAKSYRIVLEGIDESGKLIHIEKIYQ